MQQTTVAPQRVVRIIEPTISVRESVKTHYRVLRVAAYCRVSTKQEEQLNSYENQVEHYTERINSENGWMLEGIYADKGISGTSVKNRDEFNRMIRRCKQGKIDMIITKSIARFARNTVDCLKYVRLLNDLGVDVYFEEQGIHSNQPGAEFYITIYGSIAQSESENISANIKWGKAQAAREGKVVFRYKNFLGYRKGEDGQPEIVPEEAETIRFIYDRFLAGDSLKGIAKLLEEKGIKSPTGKAEWQFSTIQSILSNERYKGDAIINKTYITDCISKKVRVNNGERPKYYVENSHPAIVSREIFNKAQEESARRKAKTPQSEKMALTASGKYSKYALTEVMMCGECGSRYKRVTWNIRGKHRIVWRCMSRLDYGKKYCADSITVDERALQRAIVRALNRFNIEDESTYLMLMKSTIGEAIGINGGSDEIDMLERRIDALNKRMLDLVTLSVQEDSDAEDYEDEFKNISMQIEQLSGRITAIRESESEDGELQARIKEIQDTIDKRKENKDTYDDSIVRQMVECIKVYHDGRLQIILGGGYELEEYLEK